MTNLPTVSSEDARRVIDAALAKARELGAEVCVAVVDRGGNLQELKRTTRASFLTVRTATNKAVSAAGFGMPTGEFGKRAGNDPVLLSGISAQPDVALLPGGVPLVLDGSVAGGVGVSGGAGWTEDQPIAEAGALSVHSGQ